MKIAVILPAAGMGSRFADRDPERRSKLELPLPTGRCVLLQAVSLFAGREDVAQILVAVNPDGVAEFTQRWGGELDDLGATIVPGGRRERWETVLRAIDHVDENATHIAVHDAARPLTSPALIDRVFAAALEHPAVIPGQAVSSTLKRIDADHRVTQTVSRAGLVAVQTPQVFEADLLRRAYAPLASGEHDGAGITDDAGLVEALGPGAFRGEGRWAFRGRFRGSFRGVFVVEGEATNLKITTPEDARLAAAILTNRGDGRS